MVFETLVYLTAQPFDPAYTPRELHRALHYVFGQENFSSVVTTKFRERIIRAIRSRRMRWAGHVAHMGEMRNACNFSVGKPEGKRLLRRRA
jgi:hypothetical protein